jgi:hypothetical protein
MSHKTIILAVAAVIGALTFPALDAKASIVETYECGAIKSNPPDNDRDPIVKSTYSA